VNEHPQRLQRRLLLRLMLPLLVIFAAAAGVGVYGAQSLTDGVFDRWLLDAAQSLAHQVRVDQGSAVVDLPPAAAALLAYDDIDKTSFSVTQGSRHLIGQAGIPVSGRREAFYRAGRAFDALFEGEAVRVAAVEIKSGGSSDLTVLIAETTRKRHRAQKSITLMMLPMGLLLVAAAVTIGVAVRRTIRPLETIASRWNERSHASLQSIDIVDIPGELMPFATALNDLLARLRAMLVRERQFATTAAHQLRTPLAGLQLGLARAAAAPDLESVRQVLHELEQSTQRTARLSQQLLMFGRLDPESSQGLDRTKTNLVDLTRDVGSAFAESFLDKGISFELREPDEPILVNVQPELIAEAIGNILDNALRHTPGGGRVVIAFESLPATVRVCDSGHGVGEDEYDSIFERFVRGRGASGIGSGLGLAIVRDVATLHGARARARPAGEKGLCVEIVFSDERPLQET
jgi:two-component system sensor histidine kinase TctE